MLTSKYDYPLPLQLVVLALITIGGHVASTLMLRKLAQAISGLVGTCDSLRCGLHAESAGTLHDALAAIFKYSST